MPEFDIDAALSFPPWESFEHLVATANGGADISGPPKPGEVCFYPGGGGDWEPLVKFPNCKVFVYCDLPMAPNHGAKPVAEMVKDICGSHQELTYRDNYSWEGDDFHEQMLEWEKDAAPYLKLHVKRHQRGENPNSIVKTLQLTVSIYRPPEILQKRRIWVGCFYRNLAGHEADTVTILYLPVESLSAYVNLYFVNRIAPGVICFKPYVGFSCGQLSGEILEAYGTVLKNEPAALDSLLVVPPGRRANTPWMSDWSHERSHFPEWRFTAYATTPAGAA